MSTTLAKSKGQVFLADEVAPRRRVGSSQAPAFRVDIRRSLAMHPGLFWLTFLLVTFGMLGYALTRKVLYEADAVFFFSPTPTQVLPQEAAPGFDSSQYDAAFQQLLQTFTRVDTAEAAIRSLPESVWRAPGEPVRSAAMRLLGGLSVERTGTSFQLDAKLSGPRKNDTKLALDAISKQFVNAVHDEETGSAGDRLALLREEASRINTSLDENRAEQARIGGMIGVARLNDTATNPLDTDVDILKKQISDIRRARDLAGAGLSMGGEGGGGGDGGDQSGGVVTSTSGLISSLNGRKAILQTQMAGMTAANPLYQIDQMELKNIDKELVAGVHRSESEVRARKEENIDHAVSEATNIEGRLRGELAEQTNKAVTAAPLLQRYAGLNSEITRLQARLGITKDAIQTVSLQQAGPSRIHTQVPAEVSDFPETKRRNLVLLAALPMGLFAGILISVFAHNRDQRVFLAGDLEKVLGFKPMAVLPLQSEVSDAITDGALLKLASSIEAAYLKNRSKTFVFSAANPDTNVEQLVYNVQRKLGELGYSALWIGSETLLRPESEFEALYGRGPSMATPDRFSDGTTDGIAAARLAWMKRDYDIVLIDAPPVLNSAEAEYAIRRSDATILVSESGVTTRDDLQMAGDVLERLGAHGIGAVIQDLRLRYADPTLRRAIARSEEKAAKPVRRDPVDNAGSWEVLNQGTAREVYVPPDPGAPRYLKRSRVAVSRASREIMVPRKESATQDSSGSVMVVDSAPLSDEYDVQPGDSSAEVDAYQGSSSANHEVYERGSSADHDVFSEAEEEDRVMRRTLGSS